MLQRFRNLRQYRLLIAAGGTLKPVSLKGESWVMGRSSECDIHLPDPLVSRRHALLFLENDGLWLRDLGARNPILCNEKSLGDGAKELADGDRIWIGNTLLYVQALSRIDAEVVEQETDVGDGTVYLSRSPLEDGGEVLRLLGSLAEALQPVESGEDAAKLTLDFLLDVLPSHAGLIARLHSKNNLRLLAVEGQPPQKGILKLTQSLIHEVKKAAAPICIQPDPKQDTVTGLLGTLEGHDCLFASPLYTRGELTGLIYLERPLPRARNRDRDLHLLACLARILGSRLETLDMVEHLLQENIDLRNLDRIQSPFLATAPVTRKVAEEAEALAKTQLPLLIHGEPGVGKVTLARHIHHLSDPLDPTLPHPFVLMNESVGSSIEEVEWDIFGQHGEVGYKNGGRVQAAHGGTLCIRNFHHMDLQLQQRLVQRLKGMDLPEGVITPRLRLILTAPLPLDEMGDDQIHPELAAYIGPMALHLPPLRGRREDIPVLCATVLDSFARRHAGRHPRISPRSMDRLRAWRWPGNAAELERVLLRAALLSRGSTIYPKQLDLGTTEIDTESVKQELPPLAEVEQAHILRVLESMEGNKKLAAKVLGISTSTLYDKLKKFDS